jgi:3-oxoacyl-(acyl-carrier-protein) synthase
MARFAQYALAASEEALQDAGWMPSTFEQKESTVRCLTRPSDRQTNEMAGNLPGLGHRQF